MDPERVVVKVLTLVDGTPTEHTGRFLVSYDPHWDDGLGKIETTAELSEATVWNLREWHELYSTASGVRPWDGKPNRPITAWNLELSNPEDVRP
jgi:hypothetical protein